MEPCQVHKETIKKGKKKDRPCPLAGKAECSLGVPVDCQASTTLRVLEVVICLGSKTCVPLCWRNWHTLVAQTFSTKRPALPACLPAYSPARFHVSGRVGETWATCAGVLGHLLWCILAYIPLVHYLHTYFLPYVCTTTSRCVEPPKGGRDTIS